MGSFGSKLLRHARRFNVENRASRVISKDKPKPAPRHPTELRHIKEILRHQSITEELAKKNLNLDERLRQVYVVSQDPLTRKYAKPSERARAENLPRDRRHHDVTIPGVDEVESVAPGKISLTSVMKMLAERQGAPDTFTARLAADKYNISERDAELVLRYFASFEVYIPDSTAQPTSLQQFLAAFRRPLFKNVVPKTLELKIDEVKKLPDSK